MKPVFYTHTGGAVPLAQIICHAHTLGFELVPFEGYSNTDLGWVGRPGDRASEAQENKRRLVEITSTYGTGDEISIYQAHPAQSKPMEDDEALATLRSLDPSLGDPDI